MIAPIAQMGNIGSQFTEAFAGLDRFDARKAIVSKLEELSLRINLMKYLFL